MRLAWVLVIGAGCSTSSHTTHPDRVKDDVPQAAGSGSGSGAANVTPGDAAAATGPNKDEVIAALHTLGSEHGARDIPNVQWWRSNAEAVRPHLRAMLADGTDDGGEDRWAMQILGDIGNPLDVDVLTSVLTTWKLDTARESAAAALGVHPAPAARDALISVTNDKNIDTASYATSALGSRKNDDVARARLEELLGHADQTIRFRAVNALAEMGGSTAALKKRRKIEKDAEVKGAIDQALRASSAPKTP